MANLLLFGSPVFAKSYADASQTLESSAENSPARQRLVQEDWLCGERIRVRESTANGIATTSDAAGGCDGIKNGEWGFHTGNDSAPWWQVDLGRSEALLGVKIWNRSAAAERAGNVCVEVSTDGKRFKRAYQHNGVVFHGFSDSKPLVVDLRGRTARFVRISLPAQGFLHLDEIEVFGENKPTKNLALGHPADQSSVSQWSVAHDRPAEIEWQRCSTEALAKAENLLLTGNSPPDQATQIRDRIADLRRQFSRSPALEETYIECRKILRELVLSDPLLKQFDQLLFTKRVPASFNHMSDQYYGWWSKPGGGIYLLKDFLSDTPTEVCLTSGFKEAGSFLRPMLSYDGTKVVFAWCRYYPHLANETNKLNKANIPEDAFYHLFEMNIDGNGVRQITRGKYDDFDGRYLPDGRIVFLSTRRGQTIQAGWESARRTEENPALPDCYVRCGGGPERPVAVYTLHTINADGTDLCAISPFEMFEWTPDISYDGSILYSRWDYIDRDNMPYMGLWAMNPDGSNVRLVYKNYTKAPHCTFEARAVPNSRKLVFTASAHHAHTMGSLVMLDPSVDNEGSQPIVRLTPEVAFPEIEGWPLSSYANPWPLSESLYLVSWGAEGAGISGPKGWSRWHAVQRPPNGMALYIYNASTQTRELIHTDPSISCGDPIPVRARVKPPVISTQLTHNAPKEGKFFVADVYRGLTNVSRGDIKSLRLVAVPAKTHPTMNFPRMGVTRDDPGKCVLGTVPVEADGSACFRVPSGVILFFQALDSRGVAVQTMRSVTQVQPGETMSCIGCHEHRRESPSPHNGKVAVALQRAPSAITPGPEGSWVLSFDSLIVPVLKESCVGCHNPGSPNALASKLDLSPANAYETLINFGKPNLTDQVMEAYRRGFSVAGQGIAEKSALLSHINNPTPNCPIDLDGESRERFLTWLDTYAQRLGFFSTEQAQNLEDLKRFAQQLGILKQRDAAEGRGAQ